VGAYNESKYAIKIGISFLRINLNNIDIFVPSLPYIFSQLTAYRTAYQLSKQ